MGDDADREALAQKWLGSTDPESVAKILNSPLYFTRTRGLFRECYPGQKSEAPQSPALDLYMSPVETWCRNLDYYIPDEDGITNNLDAEQMTRIHMNRAMVALFIVGFFFMFFSFTAGVRGCWKTSPSNITASAILMLIACLFSAGGMGLWHGVEHWERTRSTPNPTLNSSSRVGTRTCLRTQSSSTSGATSCPGLEWASPSSPPSCSAWPPSASGRTRSGRTR